MKVLYNKRFSFILTFALHYVILDFIWTEMENAIYGHTMPSTEDSMILILGVLSRTCLTMYLLVPAFSTKVLRRFFRVASKVQLSRSMSS